MKRSNVIINLLGLAKETPNFSFEDVHIHAARRIATLAAEAGVAERLIHVSCLGASENAPSRRLRTKVRPQLPLSPATAAPGRQAAYSSRRPCEQNVHEAALERLLGALPSSLSATRTFQVPGPCPCAQAAGEKAVLEVFPDATIVRPGPLVGQEDKLYNTFARMAKSVPFFPLIGGGTARRQARLLLCAIL